jgi:hypothetical protein
MERESTQIDSRYTPPTVTVLGAVEKFTLTTSPAGTQKIGGTTDTQGKRNKP